MGLSMIDDEIIEFKHKMRIILMKIDAQSVGSVKALYLKQLSELADKTADKVNEQVRLDCGVVEQQRVSNGQVKQSH